MSESGNDGLTVSPGRLRGLAERWRTDGSRVSGFGTHLRTDVAMRGARTFGALLHLTSQWRDEFDREGGNLTALAAAPDALADAAEGADALAGAALGGAP